EAGASAVVMITCSRTHQTMDRRETVKHASSSSALKLPLWVMLLQVTVEENWKRDFAQLYKTQASRGGLTPPPTCHTSARWSSPNGGCGRSATKGVFHDYSSQLAYRRSRCVDLCASYCSSRKPHGDPGCAGSTRLLWLLRSATNRLPLSLWKIAGWRPDPRSRRRTSTSHTAGEARL